MFDIAETVAKLDNGPIVMKCDEKKRF